MTWLRRPGIGVALLIGCAFVVAAAAYWFLGRYIDPAGTVLLVFAGGSIGFGIAVLLRAALADE
jgi:hypothetical protein